MDLDFWWLLIIPVAFALGWMASRYDLKTLLSENATLPRSYFRGLNFLLNEQHDKAIDAFIEVAKLDPETIELHFALGNLFRRRGETDRAIRVHQNLLSRADLPVTERDHASFELGQDFLKAGPPPLLVTPGSATTAKGSGVGVPRRNTSSGRRGRRSAIHNGEPGTVGESGGDGLGFGEVMMGCQ